MVELKFDRADANRSGAEAEEEISSSREESAARLLSCLLMWSVMLYCQELMG